MKNVVTVRLLGYGVLRRQVEDDIAYLPSSSGEGDLQQGAADTQYYGMLPHGSDWQQSSAIRELRVSILCRRKGIKVVELQLQDKSPRN
jgi:hypothetical protein